MHWSHDLCVNFKATDKYCISCLPLHTFHGAQCEEEENKYKSTCWKLSAS